MNHYENIPPELQKLKQWVCADGGSKIPFVAYANEAASSTKPETWSDFKTALESVTAGYYEYCGFVFADNGYVGIDIDCGYDEDGFINELGADIIGRCHSYTEKSRSGRGFHIILRGDLPFKGKNNLQGVEIYKCSRYFILTGNIILYRDIVDNQEAIDYVVKTYFPETEHHKDGEKITDRIYTPVWGNPIEGKRVKLRPMYPKITSGSRNLSLTSLAGTLHTIGYTKTQIYNELRICNQQACKPPLTDNEIRTICNSVTRYQRKTE